MKRGWVALVLLAAGIAAIGGCGASHRPGQFTLQLKPVAPLSAKACVSQAARYGWSMSGATVICQAGKGRSWYRAVLANNGPGAYPACTATARGPHGRVVFNGPVRLIFGGFPAGLFAPGHRSVAFRWYLPRKTRGPIARYTATCSVNSSPPV